jgi:hypothetical protein
MIRTINSFGEPEYCIAEYKYPIDLWKKCENRPHRHLYGIKTKLRCIYEVVYLFVPYDSNDGPNTIGGIEIVVAGRNESLSKEGEEQFASILSGKKDWADITTKNRSNSYDGIFDLYINNKLFIGGFDFFNFDNNFFYLYWGTESKIYDFATFYKFDKATCLVLNKKNMSPLFIKKNSDHYNDINHKIFNNQEELIDYLKPNQLFEGYVYIDYSNNYIISDYYFDRDESSDDSSYIVNKADYIKIDKKAKYKLLSFFENGETYSSYLFEAIYRHGAFNKHWDTGRPICILKGHDFNEGRPISDHYILGFDEVYLGVLNDDDLDDDDLESECNTFLLLRNGHVFAYNVNDGDAYYDLRKFNSPVSDYDAGVILRIERYEEYYVVLRKKYIRRPYNEDFVYYDDYLNDFDHGYQQDYVFYDDRIFVEHNGSLEILRMDETLEEHSNEDFNSLSYGDYTTLKELMEGTFWFDEKVFKTDGKYRVSEDYLFKEYIALRKKQVEKDKKYNVWCDNKDSFKGWTMEDSWDAMTDGMYGDYPGDFDMEHFGV